MGEVLDVTVMWNNVMCLEPCGKLLQEKFLKMPQVQEVSIDITAGQARIKWKPKAPFSYYPVKTTMQMVGLGVNEMKVTVRGKAKVTKDKVVLVSLQNNTPFELVSLPTPEQGLYVTRPNQIFMKLDPGLAEKIMTEAKEDKILIISGPLYSPWRSPPLQLVVESIQVEKKK